MVLARLRRELDSIDSYVAVAAIAVAFAVTVYGGHVDTMESGFPLLFVMAVYPGLYYRESGATITKRRWGLVYGAGLAAGNYVLFFVGYGVARELSLAGIAAEGVAFLLATVVVVGGAVVERHYVNEPTTDGSDE